MTREINSSNHIVPVFGRNGWAFRKSDTTRASRIFRTQEEAIAYGTMVSNIQKTPLYIHNSNYTVAREISVDNNMKQK